MLDIAIEDSGVGMSRSQLARLFTPFTKIKTNRELNKEGVGLGLTVSKNIAMALGGDITVKSERGTGSRFTLQLPIEKDRSLKPQESNKINASNASMINQSQASFES